MPERYQKSAKQFVGGNAVKELRSTYDRLQEAHWHIHQMEENYHESEPFRFSLNSYLRVLKEIPQILLMEMQNTEGFTKWYKTKKDETLTNPLLSGLFKKRDILVHQSMLLPRSKATLGITNGKSIKAGLMMNVDPLQDSDEAIFNYLLVNAKEYKGYDVMGIIGDDEDTFPCIEREWGIDPFTDDILDLSSKAWHEVAKLFSETIVWLGGDEPDISLRCIHNSTRVKRRLYKREWINGIFEGIRNGQDNTELFFRLKTIRYKK